MIGELKQTGGGNFVFVPEHGDTQPYLTNEANAPIDRRIDAHIVDGVLKSYEWVSPEVMTFKDQTRKDLALAYVVEKESELTPDKLAHAKKMAREAEHVLSVASHGKWYVKVTPYLLVSDQVFGIYQFRWDHPEVVRQMKEQNPDHWHEHNYWCGMGGFNYKLGGIAYLNSDKAWVWAKQLKTILHEVTHMFGASHSNGDSGTEYAGWCYMGQGNHLLNAHHRSVVGLLDENYVAETSESDVFFLPPVEVPERDLRNGENSSVRILAPGSERYLVSCRKSRKQHYYGVHPSKADKLEVHRVPGSYRSGPSQSVTRIPVGEKRAIADNVEVQHHGWHEGVAKVSVIVDGKAPEDKDYPEPLPSATGMPFGQHLSGLWEDPKFKHQGVDLYVHGEDRVTGYWYTYHPYGERGSALTGKKTGKEWFVLDGHIDPETNVVDIDIIQVRGRVKKPVGRGTMRLDENGHIMFRSYTESYGRDHWALERASTTREAPSGLYKSGEYEGYSVGMYRDPEGRPVYTVYYYGHAGGDELQWYVYTGRSLTSLPGYNTKSRYKEHRDADIEPIDPINIEKIQEKYVNLLPE